MNLNVDGKSGLELEARYYNGDHSLFLYDGRYRIPIFPLKYNEIDFVAGRFIRYRKNITYHNSVEYNRDYISFTDDDILEEIITWIAENVDGFWNIYMHSKWNFIFNFENIDDATLFKLRWG